MAELIWMPEALKDLDSIADYIARDSFHYAQLFVIDALEVAEQLRDFPKIGRVVPEINDSNLREIIFGNYRIIYRIKNNHVEVLTVYHGARILDPKQIIKE